MSNIELNNNVNVQLYNEQLEQQILGCVLIENKILRYVELELTEDSFYFALNKTIFNTIKQLLQDDRQADENTVYYLLIDRQDIELKNEALKTYIHLLVSSGAGATSTIKDMVKILNFLSLKRKLSLYYKDVFDVVNNGGVSNIDENIGVLEQKIYNITNSRRAQDNYSSLNQYTKSLAEKLQKARKSEKSILGVRTGLTDMDNYTGGLQKGDLIIIAARPSMGKTALATTIAKNIAEILHKENHKQENDVKDNNPQSVVVFSLEMSGEQLAARIVAMDSKFNTKTIHTGRYDEKDENGNVIEANKKINDNEWSKIYQSMQDVGELPLYIDDTPALNISVLRSRARYMKNRYKVGAIIVDYLQLIRPSKNVGGNRVLEIAEITSTLKAIAKELEVPVVALSQLSRAVEGTDRKDKRPQLSDLRESGTIEQDADIVMLLYREEYYMSRKEPKITDPNDDTQLTEHARWVQKYEKIKNLAEVIVAKNRNGPVGTITLSFDREHMLFSGYDPNRDPYGYAGNVAIAGENKSYLSSLNNNNQEYRTMGMDDIPSIKSVNDDNVFLETRDESEIPDDLKDIFE